MDRKYTISEMGKLLGLSNDAIRFYEKKGLVHPSVNEENHYRYYTMTNMLELLDVIYYRHLDLTIADICKFSETMNPVEMMELLKEKEKMTRKRIRYEKQLLKKVVYIRKVYEEIERNENQCSIRAFPESIILFESRDRESFLIRDIDQMSQEQFVLCAFHDCYELKDGEVNRLHTFVSMETAIMSDLGLSFSLAQGQVLKAKKCVHLCVQMKDRRLSMATVDRMREFARSQGCQCEDVCYVREIPLTFYHDLKHYYAEIFIPLR